MNLRISNFDTSLRFCTCHPVVCLEVYVVVSRFVSKSNRIFQKFSNSHSRRLTSAFLLIRLDRRSSTFKFKFRPVSFLSSEKYKTDNAPRLSPSVSPNRNICNLSSYHVKFRLTRSESEPFSTKIRKDDLEKRDRKPDDTSAEKPDLLGA